MWPNGQVYDGEFKADDCNGFGTLHYPDGKRYEGNWKDGKKHGKGTYVWPNGAKYIVVYVEGKKKDQGKLESNNVSLEQLKSTYGNISKRAINAERFLEFEQFNQTAKISVEAKSPTTKRKTPVSKK